ncbi:GMP synthase (glutamine-hydrolysing) [Candidatus Kryptonium thompsonii]|uniref:GMP synthase [glutamine-hydrolyzing] n=3 Tax=Candidatus Kryptonium thompsonii TaxID=1633631 RepID=A0ABM9UVW6_9BACT|nr:glutamine-hydrolyzing GMP synthase [Candidatus Kryptonium thompsoni]CUS76404.1 GMP synthase (glutamine-hydrolysing) [Candidatus Kryptonium thompsoni]CUS80596.1 GMP synthase (glutamine-hydrolysing) [Candidatus Kryptonium thompsoni]CUS91234.1 GMP synthase (glutamine-hydrolysing) [Candidatus Kryptonium thompsoni]CUS93923.1 GMP synthase (glutamine-hydrolysing) [Candidatus Kryptonium thompsoni]CUS96691.1 GMP synthase (glutamine-hydrolysing) [Candidatus Kryptonium thompsoni]
MRPNEFILILDFGSQYTQLIARRIREAGVYSEIQPFNFPVDEIAKIKPKGIILSGGPASVYENGSPQVDVKLFQLGIPVLGICYGLQLIAYKLGGEVDRFAKREYGKAILKIEKDDDLFYDLNSEITVWMSHGDALVKAPPGFEVIAQTENSPICVIRNREKKIYGVQFHPEVVHTEKGFEILKNFVYRICQCQGGWNAEFFIENEIKEIRETVKDKKVMCAVSGGVDSTVLAVLLNRAIGENLIAIYIDNGLMRRNEGKEIVEMFKQLGIKVYYIDAGEIFLKRLCNVIDPEEKRKIIGHTFIEVFEQEAEKFKDVEFLAQGTLYPDVIESTSYRGPSAKIKTHHNVGGLPEKIRFKLIEPFRELFKDEVRRIGKALGLSDEILNRHPFPGPGLAVRVIGEVTPEKLEILRSADEILIEEIRNANLYDKIWQAFAVLLPVRSVGVMGDERSYEYVIALRVVTSQDGMTADWVRLPYDVLEKISARIVNEVNGVNRVVYDITTKPPATIEWE